MTKKERIIAKQKELIELLNKQVEFICSDICIMDSEKFGYIACDFSQKITTLEHSISSLESEPDEELFRKVYRDIAYKYMIKDEHGEDTDCVFIDDVINAIEECNNQFYPKEFIKFIIDSVCFRKTSIIPKEDENWDGIKTLDELYDYWKTLTPQK